MNEEEKVMNKKLILDLEKKHNKKVSTNKVTIGDEAQIMKGDDSDIQNKTANMVHFSVFH